jgi:hypothetical protein
MFRRFTVSSLDRVLKEITTRLPPAQRRGTEWFRSVLSVGNDPTLTLAFFFAAGPAFVCGFFPEEPTFSPL